MSKKTVFLIRNVRPEFYGGGESYQLVIAEELIKNGYEPIILTSSNRLLEEAQKSKITAIRAPFNNKQNWSGLSNFLRPLYSIWQKRLCNWYKKQINIYHPVAINIQSRDDWIAATRAGQKTNTKVLWTDHIDFRTWVLQNVDVRGKNFIGKKIMSLSNIPEAIIMISDYEAKFFKKYAKNNKNIVIMKNGVKDIKEEYSTTKEDGSIVYLGRLVDYKGINELIEAFLIVSEKEPTAILNIYGEGEKMEEYKQKAAQNERIVFHGYTDDPYQCIAKSSIFVLPSYYEGISLSLLDAAMLQKRIIATDIDGNPEVIHDNAGILIPVKNSKRLAEAMLLLLRDQKLGKELAKNARHNYEQEFNIEKNVKEILVPLLEK